MITEWEVFLAVVAIVGFCLTVFKIASFFSKLESSISVLTEVVKEIAQSNKESHQRLWDHNEEQDKQLSDHEKRIGILERLEE